MLHIKKLLSTQEIALKLARKVNIYAKKEGIEEVKLRYGMEMLILNTTKLVLILTIAVILDIVIYSFITLLVFNLIRTKAFGLHANSSIGCIVVSILLFIVAVIFLKDIYINNLVVVFCFGISFILLWRYAPADTEKRPIIGLELRKKLKKSTIKVTFLIMIVTLVIPQQHIKTLIIFGLLTEVVSVLPVTYLIFDRRVNNYEKYEREIS